MSELFVICNKQSLVFDTQFLVLNTKFIIFTHLFVVSRIASMFRSANAIRSFGVLLSVVVLTPVRVTVSANSDQSLSENDECCIENDGVLY